MGYVTTLMQPEHRQVVLQLWNENLAGLSKSDALGKRFDWAYQGNPAGAPTTVVAIHEESGQVIGCGSAYPRIVSVSGALVNTGLAADFAVARAHRIGGAAVVIQRALVEEQESGFAALLAFPSKPALAIMKRVGYTPFATAEPWIKPLTSGYKMRKHLRAPWLAKTAAVPVDVYLATSDRWRLRRHGSVNVEIVERADDRFDELWEEGRKRYPVAGERSAAYLNWRYAAFTTARYRFFCLSERNGRDLVGYIAFAADKGKIFVGDLFARDMKETAEHLLLRFAQSMRRAGAESIFVGYAGHPEFSERLRRLGFIRRPGWPRQMIAHSRGSTSPVEQLFDGHNWHLFDGEMDI